MPTQDDRLSFEVPGISQVSAVLTRPPDPMALFVMAHGAGAGMDHPFMASVAAGLGDRRVATMRYQFPAMEAGSRRPDRPPVAHAAVRAAVDTAATLLPGLPIVAGGKSFGARMTSQAQAEKPMANVTGLAAFGFPLHPAGKPGDDRAAHLSDIRVPMLFLQGDRDALADIRLLVPVIRALGRDARLHLLAGADHSFHVPARSRRTDAAVMAEALDTMRAWLETLAGGTILR